MRCASKDWLFQELPGISETKGAFLSTKNSENFVTEEKKGRETLLGKIPEVPKIMNLRKANQLIENSRRGGGGGGGDKWNGNFRKAIFKIWGMSSS